MHLEFNQAPPEVMHIDLNSAFAMTEQQANPLLRGRPVGVTNRSSEFAICIAASYEAKAYGVTLGVRLREARLRAPGFVMVESDAAKYQYVHQKLKTIFAQYSPEFYMKSVDEGVIDFRGMRRLLKGRSLEDIGYEIKQRVRDEVGDYMKVNIGIAQNRWLAKLAAGFLKPDGLYMIDQYNIEIVYGLMHLTELPYIKRRNQLRLNEAGIYTPLEFLRASELKLRKQVFRSVMGHHWYLRLRGYETESENNAIRTVGRSYVLEHRTADPREIANLLYRASAKIARRLRRNNLAARGFMLRLGYAGGDEPERDFQFAPWVWKERRMGEAAVWRTDSIYLRVKELFAASQSGRVLASIVITAYALQPRQLGQLRLYDDEQVRLDKLEGAVNLVNDRYGELVLMPASVWASKNPMPDKIPFGSVRYF